MAPSFFSLRSAFSFTIPALALLLSVGCGDGCGDDASGIPCVTSVECESGVCEDGFCVVEVDEDGGFDVDTSDTPEDTDTDDAEDTDGSETDGGDCQNGEYQCPCDNDDDCASNICITTDSGDQCTRVCSDDEDCVNPDWECRLLQTSGGDVIELCVPIATGLCDSCDDDSDCAAFGSLCSALADGSFCTTDCSNSECPVGFDCEEVTRVEDGQTITYDQCLPTLGVCNDCLDNDGDGYGLGSACAGIDCDDTLTTIYENAPETCDFLDNDCDDLVDEDFDFDTSLINCGACGISCDAAFAESICSTGSCEIVSCDAGLGDCDNDYDSGCETDVSSSELHCGSCGAACEFDNGVGQCNDGVCEFVGCVEGWGNCDGDPSNGCEVFTDEDNNNCGSCEFMCNDDGGTTACRSGICQLTSCDEGFADCDAVAANGCEVNLNTSALNCGECEEVCTADNGNAICVAGVCGVDDCEDGFADCDGSPLNGCEAVLDSTINNCGACGTVCVFPNGIPVCDEGGCVLAGCEPGFADCNGEAADGCEVDLATDADNCSACGSACSDNNADTTCVAANCQIDSCVSGFADCNGLAIDGCEIATDANVNNCGTCNQICTTENGTPVCDGGTCETGACDAGFVDCDGNPSTGCEINILDELNNCGTCGNVCQFDNGVAICDAGNCVLQACEEGFRDCDGDPTNGCEIDLNSDLANCGACGTICNETNATATCNAGTCQIVSCDEGFDDCDAQAGNGCEISLNTDVNNCATCDNVCTVSSGDPACIAGVCGVDNCDPGFADCDGDGITCETNITTDAANCGGCFTECTYADGTGICVGGICELTDCDTGFDDCDNDESNGCETSLVDNNFACGACGADCDVPNGFAPCNGTSCELLGCDFGWQDCDGDVANGCEVNVLNTTTSCGGCGIVCNVANADPVCSAGTCGVGACFGGFADCDNLPGNGCEVDLDLSDEHCGACGNSCEFSDGAGSCEDGSCELVGCASGFADCDNDPVNGCEVEFIDDFFNCGICGNVCEADNASSVCTGASCAITFCDFGYQDCNNATNDGCEVDIFNDAVNCGSCGTLCQTNNGAAICMDGICELDTCSAGFADCNLNYGDGCETDLLNNQQNCGSCGNECSYPNGIGECVAGVCEMIGCVGDFADCDGNPNNGCEVDLSADTTACGACANVCSTNHTTAVCNDGICEVGECDTNFEDCNGSAADGCEASTLTSVNNCNGCGNICSVPSGTPACVAGVCTVDECGDGFANCNGDNTDGCEIVLGTDANNCGACDNACSYPNGVAVCNATVCELAACNPGFADCNGDPVDGCEVNLNTDSGNCSACNSACSDNNGVAVCTAGVCEVTECDAGFDDCNDLAVDGCEISIFSNTNNCGACGDVCTIANGAPQCITGSCEVGACDPGFVDCNDDPSDGCEVNVLTELSNCGGCGDACSFNNGVATCNAGTCELQACANGFSDCNNDPSDGCEINLNTDKTNCGTCAAVCDETNATAACSAGVCQIANCDINFADCNNLAADGCEVSLLTDVANCASCDNECTATSGNPACLNGICGLDNCDTGFADCNGDGTTCEVSLQTDDNNCGACFNACDYANGVGNCNEGVCELVECNPGFDDCNNDPNDGCETALVDNNNNCGACGQTCDINNGFALCEGTGCNLIGCDFGWQDCDTNVANGCEVDVLNTTTSCGGCGNVCNVANADPLCSAGTCGVGACFGGFADCDSLPVNGCEVDLALSDEHCGTCNNACEFEDGAGSCTDGSCELVGCASGFADCDNDPVNGCEVEFIDDFFNCGVCGNVCDAENASSVCTGGSCAITFCDFGYEDCNNASNDGCEVDIFNDVQNCGDCGDLCQTNNGAAICVDGLCELNTCSPGFADCNLNYGDGCEIDLLNNQQNCGTCGNECSYPNGIGECVVGACEMIGCVGDFADCDGNPNNGCEVDLSADTTACGACANVCSTNHTTAICNDGVCEVGECDTNFEDCNGSAADGCEASTLTSVNNCNGCGNICSVPSGTPVCVGGVCTVDECGDGFANCNGDNTDGCEIVLGTDVDNCGACDNECSYPNGVPVCTAGVCELAACNPGFADCNNDPTDGCEINLNTDSANCSACNSACSDNNGVAVCDGGVCEITSCDAGFDDCNGIAVDGCEISIFSNSNNCGACGDVCVIANGAPQCITGSCEIGACDPGFVDCNNNPNDGCEVNVLTELGNCGGCGDACSFNNGVATCNAGTCELQACASGFSDCNNDPSDGCEINLNTDKTNCGTCAEVCDETNATAACSAGVCQIANCDINFADCNNLAADGCEVSLLTDVANCASCGNQCTATSGDPACLNGICGLDNCDAGFADCNGDGTTCEVNLLTDDDNCGTCNNECDYANGVGNCNVGVCELVECSPGFDDCNNDPSDGCETALEDNNNNCGGCGQTCDIDNGFAFCEGTGCSLLGCDFGWQDCDNSVTNGCEVNVMMTVTSCGACGTVCNVANANPLCDGGTCRVNSCFSGYDDCDSLPFNGCETDLAVSNSNCGSCGNACAYNNGAGSCNAGTCELVGCASGFADCDLIPSNGCEVELADDYFNCGGCGVNCDADDAATTCTSGSCIVTSCDFGFQDCNNAQSDGCEVDILNDETRCGTCNTLCQVNNGDPVCDNGICEVDTCDAGFDDCNDDYSDGCETNLLTTEASCGACGAACNFPNGVGECQNGSCALVGCTGSFANCDGNAANGCETDLNSDVAACGSCTNACSTNNSTPECNSGTCAIDSCDSNFADCNNSPADGCEVNLLSDVSNCNGCGSVCSVPSGTPICIGGACGVDECSNGFANCDGSNTNGCEINTTNDASNCAACGNVCDYDHGGGVCTNSVCSLGACDSGFANCDGQDANGCEIDTTSNFFNCGGCGQDCDLNNANTLCNNSQCAITSCEFGFADCDANTANGCERNIQTSVGHCGGCDNACQVDNGDPTCNGGNCAVDSCDSGFADCDNSYGTGCEINTQTDDDNCGGCGNSCQFANGVGACVGGTCELVGCASGFGNCDGDDTNGCEINLSTDPDYCGTCNVACSENNATPICVSGSCQVDSCDAGWDDCNSSAADGCETNLNADINNCGACTTQCSVSGGAPACLNGTCGINDCDSGFADCDGNVTNGCETNLNTSTSHCGACNQDCDFNNGVDTCNSGVCNLDGCVSGFGNCDGQAPNGCEADFSTSFLHCGACGQSCDLPNANSVCNGGSCLITGCDPGFFDCNGVVSDGCEVDLRNDEVNCGTCGTVCNIANGTGVCSNFVCEVASCNTGFDNCDGSSNNGCEVNLGTDDDNCGTCDTACDYFNGTGSCSAGLCELVGCDTGFGDCDDLDFNGCETNITADADHCNACGNACSQNNATTLCVSSTCQVVGCDGGFDNCNGLASDGCEINLQSDINHCGSCPTVCSVSGGSPACVSGMCQVDNCSPGQADCDGASGNGCEVTLATDELNCGACGTECTYANGTGDCVSGSCELAACSAPFDDCDNNDVNGCEANTQTDANHCGSCGTTCNLANASSSCTSGVCRIVQCDVGFADCDDVDSNGCEVNLGTNGANCGSCGTVCSANNGSAFCDGGTCAIAGCDSTHDDCDGSYGNGCEAPLNIDEANCGSCGTTCEYSNGVGLCTGGSCSMSGCQNNWGNCNGTTTDGCETFLVNNVDDCGSCGNECTYPDAVGTCSGTTCALQNCSLGYDNCDGSALNGCEVFTSGDPNNCGSCGSVCNLFQATENCTNGFCGVASCNGAFDNCNNLPGDGCEVNLNSDVNNCGTCGNICPAAGGTPVCNNGTCGVSGCTAPLADCDLNGTSCETNTNTSVSNCGNCGNDCYDGASNATMECNSGVCEIDNCTGTFDNCNGVETDGCETNTATSLGNCGGCGLTCSISGAVETCSSSTCTYVTCDANQYDLDGDMNNGYQSGDNGCEYFCTGDPLASDSPDASGIDDNCDGIDGDIANSVFVARPSNGGSNSNPGTPDDPVATIAFAITQAAACSGGPCDVIVSGGTYTESITMQDGVNLYGGFDADTWSRDISVNETIIRGVSTITVDASSIGQATTLDGFTVQGYDVQASDTNTETIAVRVNNSSSNVSIRNCAIEAGTAGAGDDGSDGGNGASGGNGSSSNSTSGAGGASSSCSASGGNGAAGRACTDGSQGGSGGTAGGDPVSGGGAGSGGSNSCSCSGFSGGDGGDGGNATSGGDGAQGGPGSASSNGAGTWAGTVWTPSVSGVGSVGKNGTGGGGGGSGGSDRDGFFGGCINARTGGGGGGGGAGGCAGTAGTGGTQGGASYAVVIINSTVEITDTEITLGTGGAGGDGGDGGDGGAGGGAGAGAGGSGGGFLSEGAGDGGNGGAGGDGGGGGGGAGGCGGPAIGIAQIGGGTATQTGVSFAGGTAGAVGSGGTGGKRGGDGANAPSGANGCSGEVANTYTY